MKRSAAAASRMDATALPEGRDRRLPQLDGLRAVAVGLVIVDHLWPGPFGGGVGVDLFFVLSGFLITGILLRSWTSRGSLGLGRFYVGRLLRLYPALITVVLVLLPVGLWLAVQDPAAHLAHSAFALTYTSNVVMAVTGAYAEPWSHTWSLAMEEQFYLVWPVILLLLLRRGVGLRSLAIGTTLIAVASAILHVLTLPADDFPDYSPLGRAHGLALGCAVAFVLASPVGAAWLQRHRRLLVGAGTVLFAVVVVLGTLTRAVAAWYVPLATLAAAAVIGGQVADPAGRARSTRLLSWRPLVYLGAISYGIYLWHYPLISLARAATADAPLLVARGSAVLAALLTFVAAAASHRFVERPFLDLKDRLVSRRTRPGRTLGASAPVQDGSDVALEPPGVGGGPPALAQHGLHVTERHEAHRDVLRDAEPRNG